MNAFGNKSLTRWSVMLAAVLFVASCGGDDDDDVAAMDSGTTPTSTGTSGTPAGTGDSTTPNEAGTNGSTDPAANIALPENTFATTLSGAQEVPPVTTNATGTGVVIIDPNTLAMKATIVTAGITGNAAHIHIAPPGVAGPIVFPLAETSTGSGIWTTQATLTANQLADLRAGNYYFNVHSTANPNGEIRGQIVQSTNTGTAGTGTATTGTTGTATTGTGATQPGLGTSITGTGTQPGLGTSTTGTGAQPGLGTSITGTGTTGTATTSGSDTIGTGTTGTGTTGMTGTTGTATTGTTGTATGDTGTSTTSGAGTSSTAVSATARTTFINVLRGSDQVPATTSSAVAIAVAIFDPVAKTLTSAITTMGITGTEAHIHQALPGLSGPIIFPLTETATGSGIWTTNAALTDEGVSSVVSGFFYFDIHSAAFPNGEVRAQLVPLAGAADADTITGGAGTAGIDTSGTVSPGAGATGTATDTSSTGTTGTDATATGSTSPAITSPTGASGS